MDLLILILDIIGTVSFAASGAISGIRKDMDLFGVCILGLTTAVGGGAVRDICLGITPPTMLAKPFYTLLAFGVSLLMFCLFSTALFSDHHRFFDLLLFISDTLGLAAFTVNGVSISYELLGAEGWFACIFLGVLTGVGGGLLRDVFSLELPYIFTRHVYASSALLGAVAVVVLWGLIGSGPAMLIGMVLILILRVLAAHFRWNLPHARAYRGRRARKS